MPYYAQINYLQKVGNSNLTIAQAGCFVTAGCNLLEKIGISIDPPTLDTFYDTHNLFTYDLTDRANDDIVWSTVSHYHPQLVVAQVGSTGFPPSDLAIVEFSYVGHTGQHETHFCAVNSAADHSIIDSYDGKVKTPAQYESYYGNPVAWATYVNNVPAEPATTIVTPSSSTSAPTAKSVSPVTPPVAPTELFLPPSVWIWHVYKPSGPYTLPYAIHTLNPKMFNGLTYKIVGNPAPHVFLINTQMYGEVAIYAGPDTVAQFPAGGHGDGEPTPDITTPAVDTPTPRTNISYAKFDEPLHTFTNKPTTVWNFGSGLIANGLEYNSPFVAVGKATTSDGQVYFMDATNFGNANETETPINPIGIKTIDLTAVASPIPTSANTPVDGEKVPVNVVPTDPEKWKNSFTAGLGTVTYVALKDDTIEDLDGIKEDQDLVKGAELPIAGVFEKDGYKYYRTSNSVLNGTWYGIPVVDLKRRDDVSEEELDGLLTKAEDLKKEVSSEATGLRKLLHRNKK